MATLPSTQTSPISRLQSLLPTDLDAGEVFSGTPFENMIKGIAEPSPFTLTRDSNYIFHGTTAISLSALLLLPTLQIRSISLVPLVLEKTSAIKQLAAQLHYPVFEVTGVIVVWSSLSGRAS